MRTDLDAVAVQWQGDQQNDDLLSRLLDGTRRIRNMYCHWFPPSDRDGVDALLQARIWEAAISFDPSKSGFLSYMHTVCHNHARTEFKRVLNAHNKFQHEMLSLDKVVEISGSTGSNVQTLADVTPDPRGEIEAERAEMAEMIRNARQMLIDDTDLTPGQKAAVTLTMLQGLSYEEAAQILGTNPKSIDNHITLARRKLSGHDCRPVDPHTSGKNSC